MIVAGQAPMECIPLVMEPMSGFYGDPVVVLDFQSLYPSMMIAYNICYSTCLGRLNNGMDDEVETALGVVSNHVVDVNCGRTTLEAAVKTVETHPTWHAKVVYGDTDSLFVQLRGRTLEQALRLGHEIAHVVTTLNPKPVCLKFEKVYMGSFLVSKKRYVGLKFEHLGDKGHLDAKGIETIRRDSCGVVQHPMRHWLRLVFSTRDLSACKKYLQEYWTHMHDGRIPLTHYIFAKEMLPSFERLAILMGVDVRKWYNALPRKAERAAVAPSLTRIDAYYSSQHCRVCDTRSFHRGSICADCRAHPQRTAMAVQSQVVQLDAELQALRRVCVQCMGSSWGGSWDSPTAMVCRNFSCAVWNQWLPTAVATQTWKTNVKVESSVCKND
ncbi:hypothetical protein DYB35_003840 [Aphanomyces astaci]|nr:hypothetical protein DYB35_003840 [Aphanomyces astaci]